MQRYSLCTWSPTAISSRRLLLSCPVLLPPSSSGPGTPHAAICRYRSHSAACGPILSPKNMSMAFSAETHSKDIPNLKFCLRRRISPSGTHQRPKPQDFPAHCLLYFYLGGCFPMVVLPGILYYVLSLLLSISLRSQVL